MERKTYPVLLVVLLAASALIGCAADEATERANSQSADSGPSITTDVIYGHDFGMALTFNVYGPRESNGAGVILTNSGGWNSPSDEFIVKDGDAWRFGTEEEMAALGVWQILNPEALVEAGFTVFDVRHGSQPKFLMPEIVSHVRQAVRFIKSNAAEYGVDSERLGLWGGSASGHLSLLVGASPEVTPDGFEETWPADATSVAAIVAFAAPTDLVRFKTESSFDRPVLRLPEEELRRFSPVTYATPDDPPTLVMHGNTDDVVPIVQGRLMYDALVAAGAEVEFSEFDSTSHGPTPEQARRGVEEARAWFEKYLVRR